MNDARYCLPHLSHEFLYAREDRSERLLANVSTLTLESQESLRWHLPIYLSKHLCVTLFKFSHICVIILCLPTRPSFALHNNQKICTTGKKADYSLLNNEPQNCMRWKSISPNTNYKTIKRTRRLLTHPRPNY